MLIIADRLTVHKYQGLPRHGFKSLLDSMLNGIPTLFGADFLAGRDSFDARRMLIFTGSIDAFFNYRFGRLRYRGQRRSHRHLASLPGPLLPAGQVNFPSAGRRFLRVLEWRHMLHPDDWQSCKGTLLTWERAIEAQCDDECEYPFPDSTNQSIYKKYAELAKEDKTVLFCGRLGSYRYLDMDHAVEEAWKVADNLLEGKLASPS